MLEGMTFAGLDVTMDMVDAVEVYLNAIRNLSTEDYPYRWIEERLPISSIHPDMFGTPDFAAYSERDEHLIIGDAKFGWQTVEPGWQGRCYAIGKTAELEDLGFTISKITNFICQPQDTEQPVKIEVFDRKALKDFEKQLRKATKGNASKAGDWCKYCPRANVPGLCDTLDRYVREAIDPALSQPVGSFPATAEKLTAEECGALLDKQEVVGIWFKAVARFAKHLAMLGDTIPGYELVESKGHRKYKNPEDAERVLHGEFGDDIYEPRQLRSPKAIEDRWPRAKVLMKGTNDMPGLTVRPSLGQVFKKKGKEE
jgi:hypothetical protein